MFPVELLEIKPRFKTEPTYGHRDVLGSLLGLGIERRMFGDIIINEDVGYVICNKSISHIVSAELLMVKRTAVNITTKIIDMQVKLLEPKSDTITLTLASLRIDSLVKGVCNCSRNEAISLIKAGQVKLNQIEVVKNHQSLHEGDILSVRTKGKFKLSEIGKVTKKGRISIIVFKYI
jgi:RNA-binding protein YlmH